MENARLFSHFIAVVNDDVHVTLIKKFYFNKKFSCSNSLFKFSYEAQSARVSKIFLNFCLISALCFLWTCFLLKKDVYLCVILFGDSLVMLKQLKKLMWI